ncbi:MarR family winged helix-turn-helix transcriptional regulator [Actinophytocola sp.]|uniref:MarR family winged helix-turn-helix transcriptional regulator n=1 Tax=Actinophytocola sp. TaxID=1872138 RepID=UPI002D22E8D8|nr:MarR family transcriptional regulator [Actinophytocola sp.]HYQ63495.1 MarR family transcriptional regulator [Actinophytocola sp.]
MSETRWLSEREQQIWRSFMSATIGLTDALARQLQRDAGMPHAYYEILVALSEAPDRTLRMSELAGIRGSSRSRLSHAIARLEETGWVRRRGCPTDKRGSYAILTEDGFAALAAAAPGHVTEVREKLFDQLTPEQVRQLGEISAAIQRGLGSVPEVTCPSLTGDGRELKETEPA